jgi:heme-degrading monooxygenase HmoA
MYVVRNIFSCKPGKAKDLVARFKAAEPHLREMGIHNARILSDTAAGFWTVVVESEVESLDDYFDAIRQRPASPELQEAMGDYMDFVTGGRREILRLE